MFRLKFYSFVLLLNLIFRIAVAQQDSSAALRDTSFIRQKASPATKGFRPYIIPSGMVSYGVLALFVPPLKNLNHSVQHQIITNDPNFSTHIDNYLWFLPTVTLYGLNAVGINGKHTFRDRTLIVLIANGIMEVGSVITKKSIHELRPDGSDYESFPSGHTTSAFTAAEYLYQEYKDVSPWIGIGGYAVATATGVLRLYNNKHYLGDVIAGAGLGIISTKIAYQIYPFVARKLFKNYDYKTLALPGFTKGHPGFTFVHHFN